MVSKTKVVSKELSIVKNGQVAKTIATKNKKTAVMAVEAVINGPKKKKVKVGTHSEEEFTCPTDKCTVFTFWECLQA